MTTPEFSKSFSDNDTATMAARLKAEIIDRPSNRLDVATGYLAISMWDAIGDALEKLSSFRLMLGKDWESQQVSPGQIEADIAALVRQALRTETEPSRLPEPNDAVAIRSMIEFLKRSSVNVKVWRGSGFFHAKAYILNSSVGVGSANLTGPGLLSNRELVMWRQDDTVVNELRDWFEIYWNSSDSDDYKAELIEILRSTRFGGAEYTPYQVFIRCLADRYGLASPPSLEQATFNLKWFQEDAVYRLIRLLSSPARGALLADAVGVGKTFMALGVIHHFLLQERKSTRGKPVLLIIPASLRSEWLKYLREYQLEWAVEIVHIQNLRGDFDVNSHESAELVVIDEAHRLRGGETWFHKTIELLQRSVAVGNDPRVLLLTATPVNTSIRDLTNLLRVITKNRRNIWAPDIPDFERHLKRVETAEVDPYPVLDRSMVRRSRSDILREYEERKLIDPFVEEIRLPDRKLAHVPYTFGDRENGVLSTFSDVMSNLYLAPYDLERFRWTEDGSPVDLEAEFESSALAGLYVAGLLKRFESSLRSISISLRRLDRVLDLFLTALESRPPKLLSLSDNPQLVRLINREAREDSETHGNEPDLLAQILTMVSDSPELQDIEQYDLHAISTAIKRDREGISKILATLPQEGDDGKIDALIDLLTRKTAGQKLGLRGTRVLLFTQFRDTAEYLSERLTAAAVDNPDIGHVQLLHGGSSSAERDQITGTFDPDRIPELEAAATGDSIPRILISTDILSEGHNLQLARAVVNYDLHWNPQVVVQRAGRVDRLNSPHKSVFLVSFLPGDNLESMLGLLERLNSRFRLYTRLGLADEPVTRLRGDQVVGVSIEQLRRLYRDDDDVLDDIEREWTLGSTDYMRAPLEAFLRGSAKEALDEIPSGVQSVKTAPRDWRYGSGILIALQYGDQEEMEAFWRFYPRTEDGYGDRVIDDIEIFRAMACSPGEPIATSDLRDQDADSIDVIDWDLLRRAADELASDLTAIRASASISRGASERSSKIRARILGALGESQTPEPLEETLDRLEQVQIEDFDADTRYDQFMHRLRSAERADNPTDQQRWLTELGHMGVELLGRYEVESESASFSVEVDPTQIRLSAWEEFVTSTTSSHESTEIGTQGSLLSDE